MKVTIGIEFSTDVDAEKVAELIFDMLQEEDEEVSVWVEDAE